MIRVRLDEYSATTGPPNGYGMRTVRLTRGGAVGEVNGTVNYVQEHRLWGALQPVVDGHAGATYQPTPTGAGRWLLQAFARERTRGRWVIGRAPARLGSGVGES